MFQIKSSDELIFFSVCMSRIFQDKRPAQNKRPPKTVIFKGGSTQNRWLLMDDFSKGGVHKTDGVVMGFGMFFIYF